MSGVFLILKVSLSNQSSSAVKGRIRDKWRPLSPMFEFRKAPSAPDAHVVWMVNANHELWCNYQATGGGSWVGWAGDWNSRGEKRRFLTICAALHSERRAQVWGIDLQGNLITCYQDKYQGDWTNWRPFTADSPKDLVAIAAAPRRDDRCTVWAVDKNRVLFIAQQKPDGGWFPWKKWIGM